MSTEACKKLIKSLTHFNFCSWKRVKKYKKNNLILRDFTNATGDILTIADSGQNISLFDFTFNNVDISSDNLKFLGREPLLNALRELSKEHMEADEKFPQYSNVEIQGGHKIISNLMYYDNFVREAMDTNISFDTENRTLFYCESNNFSYLKMEFGGDWEFPVICFAYWSEANQCIKGFFPCGEGNVYNIIENRAYIEDDYADPDYRHAEWLGVRQLANIIAKDYTNFAKK